MKNDIQYSNFRAIFRTYRRGERMPFHTDPAPRLSIVLYGELEEHTLQHSARAKPFSVVAKPEAITHRNRFGDRGARLMSIVFEEETFRHWAEAARLPAWQWFHSWEAAREGLKLLKTINTGAEESEVNERAVQLMAALRPERVQAQANAPLWLQYIAEKIRDNCRENLLVQQLAEEAGFHPVYLARAFRKYYGCSVKDFQHRHRLKHSLCQLAAMDAKLSHLAYDFGYADQAHFSRIFKREAGLSPGQFRKLIRNIV